MPAHHRNTHVHDDIDDRVEHLLELLRADGGRVTTGRRAIVQALMSAADHHVTAEQLAESVQADHPDVHLSTVYRTLEALERLGAVARLNLGPGPAVFHLRDHVHHHFVCERCGTVTELEDEIVSPLAAALVERHHLGAPHRLTITGLCQECTTLP